jgi:hypothetical protein
MENNMQNIFDKTKLKFEAEQAEKKKHLNVDNLRKILALNGIENMKGIEVDGIEVVDISDLINWAADTISEKTAK